MFRQNFKQDLRPELRDGDKGQPQPNVLPSDSFQTSMQDVLSQKTPFRPASRMLSQDLLRFFLGPKFGPSA